MERDRMSAQRQRAAWLPARGAACAVPVPGVRALPRLSTLPAFPAVPRVPAASAAQSAQSAPTAPAVPAIPAQRRGPRALPERRNGRAGAGSCRATEHRAVGRPASARPATRLPARHRPATRLPAQYRPTLHLPTRHCPRPGLRRPAAECREPERRGGLCELPRCVPTGRIRGPEPLSGRSEGRIPDTPARWMDNGRPAVPHPAVDGARAAVGYPSGGVARPSGVTEERAAPAGSPLGGGVPRLVVPCRCGVCALWAPVPGAGWPSSAAPAGPPPGRCRAASAIARPYGGRRTARVPAADGSACGPGPGTTPDSAPDEPRTPFGRQPRRMGRSGSSSPMRSVGAGVAAAAGPGCSRPPPPRWPRTARGPRRRRAPLPGPCGAPSRPL